MKITSLELKGYKRLSLNNINYLKLTPNNKIQLILGSNGSGKSSVLKELSPLPAAHTDYDKDGYKIIELSHQGHQYKLCSMFKSTGNVYNFYKNNEELNAGYTITTFKELVKREFGITQDIYEVMTSTSTFHSMSVAERRAWFTMISDADYTFAIKYYNKLKDRLRDLQGAIKLSKSRLTQETDRLIDDDKEQQLREDIKNLNFLISILLDCKQTSYVNRQDIKDELKGLESVVLDLSTQIIKQRQQFVNHGQYKSIEQLEQANIDYQSELKHLEYQSNLISQQIESKQHLLEAIQQTNLNENETIDNKIHDLSIKIANELHNVKYQQFEFNDYNLALHTLISVQPVLRDIFSRLPVNRDRVYSRDNLIKLQNEKQYLSDQLSKLDKNHYILLERKKELEHLRDHNKIECPKCRHLWSAGYDLDSYNKVISSISDHVTNINQLKNELVALDTRLEQFKDYIDLFNSYKEIVRCNPILNNIWQYLLDTSLIYDSPDQISTIVETVIYDVKIRLAIEQLNKELQQAIELKNNLFSTNELNQETLTKELEELNTELFDINKRYQLTKDEIQQLSRYRYIYKDIVQKTSELESIIQTREDRGLKLIEALRQESLATIINDIKLTLNEKEQLLSKIDIQKAAVKDLTDHIQTLTNEHEVLKLAVKELSPTEGLIARGLTNFINAFVYQMNQFIRQVWLYPLELVPMAIEDDGVDLDYKFSVIINNKNHISDITKCSTAMKEIINLAFISVSMMYLNLNEFPLYLDELGASFDAEHRKSVHRLIEQLTMSSNFSQVFIVSHYEEMYGSFKHSDINVLCSSNISTRDNDLFNKNIILK